LRTTIREEANADKASLRSGLNSQAKQERIVRSMDKIPLRSPFQKVDGFVYFARMLDKIRAHGKSALPPDYQPNLGKGFDQLCVAFLRVDYNQLVDRVKQGGSDEEILHWCFSVGRQPSEDEVYVWNEFMRKRGWNDEVSETLKRRKKEAGMAGRSEIETMFAFIDADEGRSPVTSH
jgi:hypothetical protein